MKVVASKLIFLTTLLLGLIPFSYGHDAGLSFGVVELAKNDIRITFSFSQKDIESLIVMDANLNGMVDLEELDAAQPEIQSLIREGIDLRRNNLPVMLEGLSTEPGPSETLKVQIRFPNRIHGEVKMAIPLLELFTRGHRLHMTVNDHTGKAHSQQILSASSHTISINSEYSNPTSIFGQYFIEGSRHIWSGFDHILFLLTLLLPAVLIFRNRQWHSIPELLPILIDTAKIVSVFTLAHSLTLGLAVFEVIQLPSRFTESVIAFSIFVVAINNLRPMFSQARWLFAFVFGLIHGLGFAGALTELGLPPGAQITSLIGFNLGVEVGQLLIVVLLIPFAFILRDTIIYRRWIFSGGSIAAALIAVVWMVDRVSI